MAVRTLKPFKWKVPRPAGKPKREWAAPVEPEQEKLTGAVQGQPASDIEERLNNALAERFGGQNVQFQPSYLGPKNLTEVRPDFAVHGQGRVLIIYADDEFTHRDTEQHDKVQDARLFQAMEGLIEFPVRIPGRELASKDLARQAVSQRW